MSDVNYKASFEKVYKDMLLNYGTAAVGTFMTTIALLGNGGAVLGLLGLGITAAPMLLKFMQSKSVMNLFKMPEYEIVTENAYGTRISSDGGAQSRATNAGLAIFLLIPLFFLAVIIQLIRKYYHWF